MQNKFNILKPCPSCPQLVLSAMAQLHSEVNPSRVGIQSFHTWPFAQLNLQCRDSRISPLIVKLSIVNYSRDTSIPLNYVTNVHPSIDHLIPTI